jgi:sugar transferase (PEP-CTERM system associated)
LYEIAGVVCGGTPKKIKDNVNVVGTISDIDNVLNIYKPNTLVIALAERRGTFPIHVLINAKLRGIAVEELANFYEKITGKILIKNLRPSWIIFADGFSKNYITIVVKRLFDIVMAIFGLCVSLPLMILIGIFVKVDSYGPVFFKQERVGENGKHFILMKFRTMVADAEKETGPVWSQTLDPRVTKLGNILRRTGMDEIPQLFNVLRGDMSFVGPRPERPHFVTELQQRIPYYTQRLAVKPGITGWAQVKYGYGATLEDAREKLQYDLYYIKNMSIFLDFLIILSTIHKVIFAKVAVESTKEAFETNDAVIIEDEQKEYERPISVPASDSVDMEIRGTGVIDKPRTK